MHDIFLSYASEDRFRAGQLAAALEKLGWRIWWDRSILPGKTFDKVIESELNAATCVIVLWSKISVESQWVRAEAGEALNQGRLIPVLLEDVGIPLVFRQIQAATLLDWDGDPGHAGFIQLTHAITAFAEPAPAVIEPTAANDAVIQAETTESKHPAHQSGAPSDAPQVAGQPKSGNRFMAVFWPVATLSALFVAGLAIYLNWQKLPVAEVPAVAESPVDPVIQTGQDEPDDKVPALAGPTTPHPSEAKTVAREDAPMASAGQATRKSRDPGPAVAPVTATPKPPALSKPVKQSKSSTQPEPARTEPAPANPQIATTRPVAAKKRSPVASIAPVVAIPEPKPKPVPVRILMIVWGTPNDDGLASPDPTREYSTHIAELMTAFVKDSIRHPVAIDYRYIKDRHHYRLMRDSPQYKESAALCRETNVDLLLVGFVEGAEYDDTLGYLPTREPFFSVFKCKSGKGAAKRFEVAETLGDSFPYEQSLRRVFRSFSQQELLAVSDLQQ